MTKTRKIFTITFLLLGCILIFMSFFAKLEHWSDMTYCVFAFGGFLFATTALVITIRGSKVK